MNTSFWSRPESQDALRDRHMDRLVLNEARVAGRDRQLTHCALSHWCEGPVAGVAVLSRRDGRGIVQALCASHALEYSKLPGDFIVTWATQCSSCERPVDKGWQLDASGRCLECQP
jgi:hypothetical protein